MASNKRKQDEKHLKMLREMVALPSNKTCFDCHQRGPTYVNMTIGSFVCTSCSGILRGLNPPHRVKSISMASFTPEEMDFLKSHGNELNRKVYLGLYDNRTWPEPDSRDEQRVRDFMVQKYENKRFFVAPTEAMREEARRMNDAALSKQPQTKPLRALLGENATKLVVGTSQTNSASQNNISSTQVVSTMATPPRTSVSTPVSQQPVKSTSGGFDLLGDLGSDPFASSAPAIDGANTGDFADFSKIGASMSAAPTQYAQAVTQSPGFPPMPSAPLHPFNSGSLQPQPLSATPAHSAPHTSTPAQNSATSFSAISDKYAALADLDSSFTQSSTTVNWGGSDSAVGSGIRSTAGSSIGSTGGSNINWGGGSSATGSGDGSVNWGNQSGGGSGGLSWNSSGGPASMGGTVFGGTASTTANPFGASSTPAMSQGGGIPSHANPFGTSAHPPTFAAPSTVAAGFGHSPASSAAGFGYQQQQFPVQNGGFSMATTSGGFTPFGGTHPSTAPPSYGVAQQQAFQAQHNMVPQGFSMQQPVPQGYAAGWGQMGTQPSSANPFMSAVNQRQMPPRGTSTNPFL